METGVDGAGADHARRNARSSCKGISARTGKSVAEVARSGLLRRRRWETVADWLVRFEAKGIGGLYIEAGRGRKPAFFPRVLKHLIGFSRSIG
jgi:hypothetical protein